MSEPVRLTQAQFELLRMIENGQRYAYDGHVLHRLVALGLVVAMRLGRGKQMGVSITHQGRAQVLGQNSNQVVEG
jgi:hypothetical protein